MSTFIDTPPIAFGDDDARRNLDAVRDLLFGSRNMEIDRRISQIEDRLGAAISTLEDRLNRQFQDLENGLRREIGSTQERIEEKGAATGDEVRRLGDLLKERFTEVEENVSRVESESRRLTLERAKVLKDELNDTVSQLRSQVTDKGDLGRRLMELGRAFSEGEAS